MSKHNKKTMNAIAIIVMLIAPLMAPAQLPDTLRLEDCYRMARQNYPLVKQQELVRRSSEYSIDNISKGNLPQISVSGQATYQSDVTKIPISLPGISVPALDKDQYKLYAEVNQPLTDLITVQRQKELQEKSAKTQEQQLEADLYKIRERVNQLFFGILLIDEQMKQNQLTKKDIEAGIKKISAALRNGTEFRSSLDKLNAEMLRAEQRDIEFRSGRAAYMAMLSSFVNQQLSDSIGLEIPAEPVLTAQINRPELKVFDFQREVFDQQNKLISTKTLPKFSLFAQGGLGQPSPVNMLSRELRGYYIGGLRLGWSISSFYTLQKEKKLNKISQDQLTAQEETFVFNTNQSLIQQKADILKLKELVRTDLEIVKLRTSIKNAANAQLDNGVITVNDYVKEINAEDQARLSASLHQIQLRMSQYNYNTISGN